MSDARRNTCVVGIYVIICTSNNKKYIGSSSNVKKRWRHHKAKLGAKKPG